MMRIASTIFLVLALGLAILLGAQTVSFSWGPALVALALAVVFAAVSGSATKLRAVVWVPLLLASGWVLVRALMSDVVDHARADAMLVLTVVAAAYAGGVVAISRSAMTVLFTGLSLLLMANMIVAIAQVYHPELSWPYPQRAANAPSGFFGHYNFFANFVIGGSSLIGARLLVGRAGKVERILHLLVLLSAPVGIWLCGSRGGVLGIVSAAVLLILGGCVILNRRKSKARWILFAAIPLVGMTAVVGGMNHLDTLQERRDKATGFGGVADDFSRLSWLGQAIDVIGENPWVGSGSRSYGWKRLPHLDPEVTGEGTYWTDFAHNEILQVAVDYGIVGALLVAGVLGLTFGRSMFRIIMPPPGVEVDESDATNLGVMSGLGGMLIQSNFDFVFHMLPSPILMGLMIGLASGSSRSVMPAGSSHLFLRTSGQFGMCLIGVVMGTFGFQASRALIVVFPALYGDGEMDPAASADRISEAGRLMPGYEFLQREGDFSLAQALEETDARIGARERWMQRAEDAYRRGLEYNPHRADMEVNRANILSSLGRAEDASAAYENAIARQGGLEGGTFARFYYAKHLYKVWYERWTKERRAEEALDAFLQARDLINQSPSWTYKKLDGPVFMEELDRTINFLEGAGIGRTE